MNYFDNDELADARLREQEELVTEQLCEGMIECSQSLRAYLLMQEDRLRNLMAQIPDDPERIEAEVSTILKQFGQRLIGALGAIGDDSPAVDDE